MVDWGPKDSSSVGNRFVCPNDRQLALRAKLRTGWSVKTATLNRHGGNANQPLCPEEHAAIVNVIKRAEEVDLTEQERVGRLMERLDNLRRNALGRNPSQCLLCGDGFGLVIGAQKVICVDCRRLVCQKCSIETATNKNVGPKSYWLCMICAETREIWKKSGAWFFKSIPKYILPGEKHSIYKVGSAAKMSRSNNRGLYKDDDSSSDEDRKMWTRIHRRNSSTESMHGDVHESIQESNAMASNAYNSNSSRQMSSSESQLSKDMTSLTISGGGGGDYGDEGSYADETDVSRRESATSRSLTEWNWSEGGRSMGPDDKISPSTSSIASSVFKSSTDDSLGSIELSLTYDPVTTTLHCTVYRAKNLIPMDINGLSDPFCKLNILPNAKVSTRLRTKTVHKTRNPEFNENLTFYDITDTDLLKRSLHVLVVDDDKYGHDYMGETKINLAKLKQQNTIYVTAPLEKLRNEQKGPLPAPELNQWFDDDLWSRGQILLSLCYSTKRRSLLVTVCRCTNLLPMDNNGFSDPFVKLQLRPDPYHRKHKTSIKWKNLNPIFNEEFAFETRPTELAVQSLYITVFDKDYGKSNDYLGGLILGGSGSKGLRLKHWLDMIRYPDHRHEAWHNLTEEVLD